MNTMVQEMSWNMAAQQEGARLVPLDVSEVKEVSGGSPLMQHVPEILGFAAAVATLIGALRG